MAGTAGFEPAHTGVKVPCLNRLAMPLYALHLSFEPEKMERVTGIEPASPAWKAGALAVVLHPQLQLEKLELVDGLEPPTY